MTRVLMHPLVSGGNLARVQPGRWHSVQRPDQISEIQLTENVDRSKRPEIASIPSPWARLQVFRDAILEKSHPYHEDAVNDVLDAIEVVFFQDSLAGVKLTERVVTLDDLERAALAERKQKVARF